jgi:hypothetical protein
MAEPAEAAGGCAPAPGMVWIPRWDVLDGFRQPLSRGGARPHGQRRRLLDRPLHRHQPQFAQFVAETGHVTVDELAAK